MKLNGQTKNEIKTEIGLKLNTKPNARATGSEMLVKDRFGSSYSKGDEKKFIERVDISWCLQLTAANESNRYVAGFSFSRNSIRAACIRMLLASDIAYWLLSNYRVITHSWPHVSNEIHRKKRYGYNCRPSIYFAISETAPEFKWYGFHFTNEHLYNIVVKTAQWIFTNNLLFSLWYFRFIVFLAIYLNGDSNLNLNCFGLELEIIFGSDKDLRMVNTNNVKWCYFIDSEEIETHIEKIPNNNNNCKMKQNETNFIESDFSLDNVIQGKSIRNWKFRQINCYEVLSSDPTNCVEFGTNKNTKTMCRNKNRTHRIALHCDTLQWWTAIAIARTAASLTIDTNVGTVNERFELVAQFKCSNRPTNRPANQQNNNWNNHKPKFWSRTCDQ